MRQPHGPGMKGRDLVLVLIGHDGALGGVAIFAHHNVSGIDFHLAQTLKVMPAVLAHGGQRQGIATELLDRIGDVARTAAVVTAHVRREEGNAQLFDLLRQDVVGKPAIECQDVVESHRTGNENGHAANTNGVVKDKKQSDDSQKYRAAQDRAAAAHPRLHRYSTGRALAGRGELVRPDQRQ